MSNETLEQQFQTFVSAVIMPPETVLTSEQTDTLRLAFMSGAGIALAEVNERCRANDMQGMVNLGLEVRAFTATLIKR